MEPENFEPVVFNFLVFKFNVARRIKNCKVQIQDLFYGAVMSKSLSKMTIEANQDITPYMDKVLGTYCKNLSKSDTPLLIPREGGLEVNLQDMKEINRAIRLGGTNFMDAVFSLELMGSRKICLIWVDNKFAQIIPKVDTLSPEDDVYPAIRKLLLLRKKYPQQEHIAVIVSSKACPSAMSTINPNGEQMKELHKKLNARSDDKFTEQEITDALEHLIIVSNEQHGLTFSLGVLSSLLVDPRYDSWIQKVKKQIKLRVSLGNSPQSLHRTKRRSNSSPFA